VKTIFWDFDGTLAFNENMFSGTLLKVLDDFLPNHNIKKKELSPYLKSGFPWHNPEKPHLHLNDPEKWWEELENIFLNAYVGVDIKNEDAKIYAKYAHEYYINPSSFQLFDDTYMVLKISREKGFKNIILSNHVPELPMIVKELGLNNYIDDCITSAKIGYEKPHPEIYKYAIARAKGSKEMWMVGDNIKADIIGAEKMGIKGILVHNKETVNNIKYQASGLADVVEIITN